MNDRYRVVALFGLLVLLGGLCVWYATADLWDHPSPSDIADDPTAHDGESLLLFGDVRSVDQNTETVSIESGPLEATVHGVDPAILADLEAGGSIQVEGTVEGSEPTIAAETVVVDHRGPTDWHYVYATSIVGAALAIGAFLRYWRIDLRRLRFEQRGER